MVAQAAPATPHLKTCHEPDVQYRVHCRADQQEDQRHKAVPKPPQDAREDVVKGEADDADEDDSQVIGRHVHNFRWGVQKLQERPGEQHAAYRHQDADQQGQHHCVADRLGEELAVPGAEVLGDHDPGAGRDADEEDQQQVVDRPARTRRPRGRCPRRNARRQSSRRSNKAAGRCWPISSGTVNWTMALVVLPDGHIPRGKKLRDFVLCHFVSPAFLCLSI